ncbi:hypothetical protein OEZ85_012274 [Tetradesmus obliquus]|uniref:Uncharacterized protein n=1 Tax=Tetradesmus obliquus TaxID=3088 RepID=A0ABY8TSW9_TETOB|nr:hypothetical protein OEZ85_012274 [Tetradesmus obliquus]
MADAAAAEQAGEAGRKRNEVPLSVEEELTEAIMARVPRPRGTSRDEVRAAITTLLAQHPLTMPQSRGSPKPRYTLPGGKKTWSLEEAAGQLAALAKQGVTAAKFSARVRTGRRGAGCSSTPAPVAPGRCSVNADGTVDRNGERFLLRYSLSKDPGTATPDVPVGWRADAESEQLLFIFRLGGGGGGGDGASSGSSGGNGVSGGGGGDGASGGGAQVRAAGRCAAVFWTQPRGHCLGDCLPGGLPGGLARVGDCKGNSPAWRGTAWGQASALL